MWVFIIVSWAGAGNRNGIRSLAGLDRSLVSWAGAGNRNGIRSVAGLCGSL